jgi:hypothetical protein
MNTSKVIGICHRMRLLPLDKRGVLLDELSNAIDEGEGYTANRLPQATNTLESLCAMLDGEGVRNSLKPFVHVDKLRTVLQIAAEKGRKQQPANRDEQDSLQVTNSAGTVEGLRAMLRDPGIRDNGKAQAALVLAIRAAQAQQ